MRTIYAVTIACVSAAAGMYLGNNALLAYANAPGVALKKAHCAFKEITTAKGYEIPGRLVSLVSGVDGQLMWLMNAAEIGPSVQAIQNGDGGWSIASYFSTTPTSALLTVDKSSDALLSIHHADMAWSTQAGHCIVNEIQESS